MIIIPPINKNRRYDSKFIFTDGNHAINQQNRIVDIMKNLSCGTIITLTGNNAEQRR
jgi:hypothetical protein